MNTPVDEPTPFDFWLEYLAHTPNLAAWENTFVEALISWQQGVCWRLLRQARQGPTNADERAIVRHNEGLLHAQGGDWPRAQACYQAALNDLSEEAVKRQMWVLGDLGMIY